VEIFTTDDHDTWSSIFTESENINNANN